MFFAFILVLNVHSMSLVQTIAPRSLTEYAHHARVVRTVGIDKMAELKTTTSYGKCCFKCSYAILIGSKSGYEVKRNKRGEIIDPLLDNITGRLCLHNPETIGKGLGFQVHVCELFELDKTRYHDLKTEQHSWKTLHHADAKGQTSIESWI